MVFLYDFFMPDVKQGVRWTLTGRRAIRCSPGSSNACRRHLFLPPAVALPCSLRSQAAARHHALHLDHDESDNHLALGHIERVVDFQPPPAQGYFRTPVQTADLLWGRQFPVSRNTTP